jgi:hypothetical protein
MNIIKKFFIKSEEKKDKEFISGLIKLSKKYQRDIAPKIIVFKDNKILEGQEEEKAIKTINNFLNNNKLGLSSTLVIVRKNDTK